MLARLAALVLFAFGMAGPALAQGPEIVAADRLPFSLNLPAGFEVRKRPPGPDFDVYDVVKDGQNYVGIYTGCCSMFPADETLKVEKRGELSSGSKEGKVREFLLSRTNGYPGQVHIWIQQGEGVDTAVAEKIARSVKFRK